MTRVFTWKNLSIAVSVLLLTGVGCLAAGYTGAASALFVVAIAEALFGAAFVAAKRHH